MCYLTNHMEHINKCADEMRSFLASQLGVVWLPLGFKGLKLLVLHTKYYECDTI